MIEENSTTNQTQEHAELPKQTQAQKNKKIMLMAFGGFIVAVLVVAVFVGIYRTYTYASTDSFSSGVAAVLRLPLAKINGSTILFKDYYNDMNAITKLRDYDRANNGATANLTDEQMSDQVLFRLANNILVEQAAKKFSLSVETNDIASLKDQIYQQAASQNQPANTTTTPVITDDVKNKVSAELMQRYGWTMDVYEKKVMRPFVLERKLADVIDTNQSLRDAVRAKAQDVLEQIKNGADFAKLAAQYGEDATAKNGGELGWFGKGEMVPQFEDAVFALKKGDVTQQLVETPYGFHIIQLEDKKTENKKDASGKMVATPQVQARHILFLYPSAQKYLDNAFLGASIKLYAKVHNPFAKLTASSTPQTP